MAPSIRQRGLRALAGVIVVGMAAPSVTTVEAGAAGPAPVSGSSVFTWGDGNAGQLGNGNQGDSLVPVTARPVSGTTAVAGGGAHELLIGAGGAVWAWGWNHFGQLGDGTTTGPQGCPVTGCSTVPVKVDNLTSVTAIAAGDIHSLARERNGSVWAWGNNQYGELGNGTVTATGCLCIDTPVKVKAPTGIVALAGGGRYSLGLRADGTVWAWGHNEYGELGNGTTTDSAVPVEVKGLSGVVAIAAGYFHAMALTGGGQVLTWGRNTDGQLGNGAGTGSDLPVPVTGLTQVRAIAGGGQFSLALRSDGTVWAWSEDEHGQLRDGLTGLANSSHVPVEVTGLAGVTALAAGHRHGLAVDTAGTVWAWGQNSDGELGNGTKTDSDLPVKVAGAAGLTQLGAGDQTSLGL
jgi:alpha-tubulin suppressor-like RCC1 family protein